MEVILPVLISCIVPVGWSALMFWLGRLSTGWQISRRGDGGQNPYYEKKFEG